MNFDLGAIGAPSLRGGSLNQTKKFQFADLSSSSEHSKDEQSEKQPSVLKSYLSQIESIKEEHNSQATTESCSEYSMILEPVVKSNEKTSANV